jgi:formylglycine-generating enzyme required for sulfatase activity
MQVATAFATERLPDYDQRTIRQSIAMVGVDGGGFDKCEYQPALLGRSSWAKLKTEVSPFWIGKYEITYREYHEWVLEWNADEEKAATVAQQRAREVNDLDSKLLKGGYGTPSPHNGIELTGSHPAFGMKQWAAKRYCHWLSMLTGHFYRLPTEAEWEFACLAGSKQATNGYPWGRDIDGIDTYAVTSVNKRALTTAPVGSKKPNAWGIHDMIGNVEEWVADGYDSRLVERVRKDAIVWPASKDLSQDASKVWKEFKAAGEFYCDGWGVAKGGAFGDDRSQQSEAFTVAARTDPERYWKECDDVYHLPQDNCSLGLEGKFAYSIGFRIARPLAIPSRKLQLWHWGIYFDHDKWQHLTLEPTEANADHRGP